MSILCLNLQQTLDPSSAEIFLQFSPRVQFRYPHWVFIDIGSTAGLFGGEVQLLKKAVDLARKISPQATGAIAPSPYYAQVLVKFRPFEILESKADHSRFLALPLLCLTELEGLVPWGRQNQDTWGNAKKIHQVIQFFQSIHMQSLEDIFHLQLSSFRERWGAFGVDLWNRLHLIEMQVVSPLDTKAPLSSYGYLDDPIDLKSFLLKAMHPHFEVLFLRLMGLGRFAKKISIQLTCEYSGKTHSVVVEPVSPSRDLNLFLDLIAKRFDQVPLENPIREFEISIEDVPEKTQQLDFFEPRDTNEDRWKRLMSFAKQSGCEIGFLEMKPKHFPEECYQLKTDFPNELKAKDWIEKLSQEGYTPAIQKKEVYAKGLIDSLRPSLLLQKPLCLDEKMRSRLKVLHRFPSERITAPWWETYAAQGNIDANGRDYYFAVSDQGQLLWVYQNHQDKKYYLQGYFD